MNKSDILRRLRYSFDIKDSQMVEIFALADHKVSRTQVAAWTKREEDEGFEAIKDEELAIFLNGFINLKRGKRAGPQIPPEKELNNNQIFRKLRIALSLKDDDILEILENMDMQISKHELSAFFRKRGQSQYRHCKDQILRKFIYGLQIKYRHGYED